MFKQYDSNRLLSWCSLACAEGSDTAFEERFV